MTESRHTSGDRPPRAHYVEPDIVTSSSAYASRFAGPVGEYFLNLQEAIVDSLLITSPGRPLQVLEVGGGHAQLTPLLLERGCHVWVQGSDVSCADRLHGLGGAPEQLHFFVSPLDALRPPLEQFDVVLAFRLLPHIVDWRRFLTDISRLARHQVIFDFAALASANVLTPLLFEIKRRIEKNTRPYFLHRLRAIEDHLAGLGFDEIAVRKQFAAPMGLHRALDNAERSAKIETLAQRIGITKLIGSPAIVAATKPSR